VSPYPNRKLLILIVISLTLCLAATIDVGSGAPSAGLSGRFVNAFYRNGFAYLVSLPPVDNVQRFGNTGLIQEFNAVGSTPTSAGTGGGSRLALIKSNMSTALPTDGSVDVAQVTANMYSYYPSVGVTTAGFPTTDTLICPTQTGLPTCEYQFFSLKYVLFTYDASIFNGSNFALRDPFYTKWMALGGINGLGTVTDIERNVTGQNSVTATVQLYANGAIYSITSGSLTGSVFAVAPPIYAAFVAQGGDSAYLGLPTSNDITLTGGGHRQSFQGGNLDYTYTPGQTPVPVLELPVASVSLQPYSTAVYQMKQGDTLPLHANLFTSNGANLTGRLVTWVSTNSRVVSIAASSGSPDAVATAVGQGTAIVSAISEGVASPSLTITVTAVCCGIGDGATPAAQQAMKDAVTRNQLAIQLPAKSPAQRVAAGYVQQLSSTGTPPVAYLLAKSDASPTAYLVTGDALIRYNALGGAAGSLGYPTSDGVGVGHQLFQNGALASSPARLVTGAILTKWGVLGFETGPAGLPTADATSIVASTGNKAQQQTFAKGIIISETSGPQAGQAQLVSGLILNRYTALGGASSAFGLPTDDAFGLDGRTHQDFEGGYIDYGPGDTVAVEHGAQRQPRISATPASAAVAGSRVRLSVTGFDDGSTLRVSITGQPDFVVTTSNGSYTWDTFVPLSTPSQTVLVHAVDTGGGATADGSYTVKSLTESQLQLVAVQGDAQSGAPGARLAQTLRVQLTDSSGTPVIGIPVTFAASTGGQILSATAVTNNSGQAETAVRLPLSEGLALFTATAARLVTTFSARAAATSLTKYPAFLQSDASYGSTTIGKGPATIAQKGALLTSAAGIIRYYVDRGDLSGGVVDPGVVNLFLQKLCATSADGSQLCDGFLANPDTTEQVVNLWRLGGLVGGNLDVSVESPDPVTVRDLVATGSPVLLGLALTANGAPAGGHYVVATGVASDGSLLIHDPSADFGRTSLNDYLTGFQAGAFTWQATLSAAVRLLPRAPSASGFLIAAISQPAAVMQQLTMDLASANGDCGLAIDFQDAATIAPSSAAPLDSRFRYCDGKQPVYQLTLGESQPWRASLTDLAAGGRRADLIGGSAIAYKVTRPSIQLVLGPQDVTVAANGVVNGASFVPGIATGGLMAIFGSGLAGPGGDSVVQVNGEAAAIVSKSPFEIMAQVPPDLTAGAYSLSVQSPFGSAQQTVQVQDTAPGILLSSNNLNAGSPAYGMVVNQDGSTNSPTTPVQRGQTLTIYCTGLGAVDDATPANAQTPVSVILNGVQMDPMFAGLVPGYIGLYQVALPVPLATPPGIDLPLFLRQPGGDSNTVFIAVQ
jgi:uncharacterized protein (TIGR03437 family)